MHYNNSLANNIPDILKSYTLHNFKSTLTPDIHIISHDPSQPHSGLGPAMQCGGPHQQVLDKSFELFFELTANSRSRHYAGKISW